MTVQSFDLFIHLRKKNIEGDQFELITWIIENMRLSRHEFSDIILAIR